MLIESFYTQQPACRIYWEASFKGWNQMSDEHQKKLYQWNQDWDRIQRQIFEDDEAATFFLDNYIDKLEGAICTRCTPTPEGWTNNVEIRNPHGYLVFYIEKEDYS